MSSVERLGAELAGALLLCGGFVLWWHLHNHAEQQLGAAVCIQSTTEVRADAVRDDTEVEAAHAAQLSQVVAVYDQKLEDSAHANDGLAVRLHHDALRQSAVSCASAVAGRASGPAALAGGDPGTRSPADPYGIDAATQAVIAACSADAAELAAIQAAWNTQQAPAAAP
jgi:hypothetical protein